MSNLRPDNIQMLKRICEEGIAVSIKSSGLQMPDDIKQRMEEVLKLQLDHVLQPFAGLPWLAAAVTMELLVTQLLVIAWREQDFVLEEVTRVMSANAATRVREFANTVQKLLTQMASEGIDGTKPH